MAELPLLPPAYEILELADGESREFLVTKSELGRMVISPRWPGAPPTKEVRALRLHTTREWKEFGPLYWDVTPATLVTELIELIHRPKYYGIRLRITKYGVPPKARFRIQIIP